MRPKKRTKPRKRAKWPLVVFLLLVLLAVLAVVPILRWKLAVPTCELPPTLVNIDPKKVKLDRVRFERVPVPLNMVSDYVIKSLLAAEDRRFYEHHGIDVLGSIRATLANAQAREMREGGSTISQQLAKNVFLDWRERTWQRKVSQWILAWDLESRYTKNQILEAYLNAVYFGNGAYGIENAAQTYFAVDAAKLTLSQSAFLVALLKSPTTLSENRKAALSRQKEILDKLEEYGMVEGNLVEEARVEVLKFPNHKK